MNCGQLAPSIYNLICILPYLTQNEETRINMQKPPNSTKQGLQAFIPNENAEQSLVEN